MRDCRGRFSIPNRLCKRAKMVGRAFGAAYRGAQSFNGSQFPMLASPLCLAGGYPLLNFLKTPPHTLITELDATRELSDFFKPPNMHVRIGNHLPSLAR